MLKSGIKWTTGSFRASHSPAEESFINQCLASRAAPRTAITIHAAPAVLSNTKIYIDGQEWKSRGWNGTIFILNHTLLTLHFSTDISTCDLTGPSILIDGNRPPCVLCQIDLNLQMISLWQWLVQCSSSYHIRHSFQKNYFKLQTIGMEIYNNPSKKIISNVDKCLKSDSHRILVFGQSKNSGAVHSSCGLYDFGSLWWLSGWPVSLAGPVLGRPDLWGFLGSHSNW